jgi:hypothetical protein
MKYFLLSLSAIVLLAACQKTPKNDVTRENILRNGKWKIASGSLVAKLQSGKDTTLNFPPMIPTCNQDDYLVFDSLYTGAVYGGATKCSPSEPDYIRFSWQLLNNGNTIVFNNPLNLLYKEYMSLELPKLDTISMNPFVTQVVYPATYFVVPYDTTTITATISSFSTSSFTLNYNIPSIYFDTTGNNTYSPVLRLDTINYTVTYNSF